MWLSFIVHMCKMIITPGSFFIFFKILIFWVVKGKKTVQNDKKFFPLHSMSQEQYIIWLSFMIHVCKMIISSGVFLYFHNLIFWVHRGVKGQKTVQNDKKFCLLHSISQKRYIIMIVIYGANVENDNISRCRVQISRSQFTICERFWQFANEFLHFF